mmetsp:Transcript_158419/g.279583  ORF Transcript_158419/g.279583 Transcript_158419/m.279583 type:complete len:433 (-) Transcript_158419:113-1411(-)
MNHLQKKHRKQRRPETPRHQRTPLPSRPRQLRRARPPSRARARRLLAPRRPMRRRLMLTRMRSGRRWIAAGVEVPEGLRRQPRLRRQGRSRERLAMSLELGLLQMTGDGNRAQIRSLSASVVAAVAKATEDVLSTMALIASEDGETARPPTVMVLIGMVSEDGGTVMAASENVDTDGGTAIPPVAELGAMVMNLAGRHVMRDLWPLGGRQERRLVMRIVATVAGVETIGKSGTHGDTKRSIAIHATIVINGTKRTMMIGMPLGIEASIRAAMIATEANESGGATTMSMTVMGMTITMITIVMIVVAVVATKAVAGARVLAATIVGLAATIVGAFGEIEWSWLRGGDAGAPVTTMAMADGISELVGEISKKSLMIMKTIMKSSMIRKRVLTNVTCVGAGLTVTHAMAATLIKLAMLVEVAVRMLVEVAVTTAT